MPLKLTCPSCSTACRIEEPLPPPGTSMQCTGCGKELTVSYPPSVIDELKQRGKHFEDTTAPVPSGSSQMRDINPSVEQQEPTPVPDPTQTSGEPPSLSPEPVSSRFNTWRKRITWAAILIGAFGFAMALSSYLYFSQDLPTIEKLQAYKPPTVTMVYDVNGELLGEIYEQQRYVVPLEEIPDNVKHAFLASEDAKFYDHGGVDYIGITRAMIKNLRQRRMAQGASTITQQVTRNFLLTKEKKLKRKIREILLAWRIESTYEKDHILFLYLNEIYLGSGSYGVEAASRVYFAKNVKDLTLPEAALLAGLPQRPSDYSPHRHFEKSKERQKYVLEQMVRNKYITKEEAEEALAVKVKIVERANEFLTKSPHFTEYVRRHLVDTYGFERVYNEGLTVKTTCDMALQQAAQTAAIDGVHSVDQRMGFRRAGVTQLESDEAIKQARLQHEEDNKKSWARQQDAAGRIALPETSILQAQNLYKAIVLEVQPRFARVAIGVHEGIIPIDWSHWVFTPNPRRSWRYRSQKNLTQKTKGEGSILQKGDLVTIKVQALSTMDESVAKAFRRTPGADKAFIATRLWQDPEVETALLSFDLETGAVRAMVGGANFEKSEFNRAIQAKRQVGSTFKPIVYGAAIHSKKVTAASMVADAPLAFATNADFIWKPVNYGHDYLGNLTLRRALALSRNTCTVRVLESVDPGMNDDVIYNFARTLGIGGPPLHKLNEAWVPKPDNDTLCPWTREHSESTICMDRFPPKDPNLSNTAHRRQMSPEDVYMCRACDMSMGLGSVSLTMEELLRAYSAFATKGKLVQPYYIEEVRDQNGVILEQHDNTPFPQVIEPEVASIANWLLRGVVAEGTATRAQKIGVTVAGKTGTTNEEKDTWFVGFSPSVITGVWVGYDQPRSLGVSSTGGRTALPIWMEYMKAAVPKSADQPFEYSPLLQWANIDETTGRRVESGGRRYPFLPGTAPEATGFSAGQVSLDDLSTEL